jgi:hypothetical protein
MNEWNKLMHDRGAVAALTALRDGIERGAPVVSAKHVVETIDTHLVKYRK